MHLVRSSSRGVDGKGSNATIVGSSGGDHSSGPSSAHMHLFRSGSRSSVHGEHGSGKTSVGSSSWSNDGRSGSTAHMHLLGSGSGSSVDRGGSGYDTTVGGASRADHGRSSRSAHVHLLISTPLVAVRRRSGILILTSILASTPLVVRVAITMPRFMPVPMSVSMSVAVTVTVIVSMPVAVS